MAANNAAIRKPDEKKNGVKKKWRGSIFMKRDNTSRHKKTGDGLPPFPLHTRRHDEKKAKMAGTVGCPRRRQNTNTQVSDNSSRNHTHTKKNETENATHGRAQARKKQIQLQSIPG